MSILMGYQEVNGNWGLCCSQCSAFCGYLTPQEARELLVSGIEPLCFDCEPDGVDEVPKHLISYEDNYFLGLGAYVFIGEWTQDNFYHGDCGLRLARISLTTYFDLKTGRGVKYTPLSSSSNLNRK